MFRVMLEMDLFMVINQWLRLSPTLFSQCRDVAKFKANFQNVYICLKKDFMEDFNVFPYLVVEEIFLVIISKWLNDWLTLD